MGNRKREGAEVKKFFPSRLHLQKKLWERNQEVGKMGLEKEIKLRGTLCTPGITKGRSLGTKTVVFRGSCECC